ncbi:MAG: BamA/TamA family outer membrane protein, partial [Proteobacteria bacterium]|nr:BamA/TamA family outer membrane protein [Pseudomonadota bacterium]
SSNAVASGRIYTVNPDDPLSSDGSLKFDEETPYYWERRIRSWFVVSYPFTHRMSVFGEYSFTHRQELNPLPDSTWLPYIPTRGTVGKLSGGWRYAWSQQTPYAISREDGRIFSLVGSFLSPYLGTSIKDDQGEPSPLTQVQLTTEFREYVVNPWVPNHVLAFRAAGGVTLGATDYMGNYQLGGSIGDGAFVTAPDESKMLRGYPFAHDLGDMYWLSGLEYRFPIYRIERGVGTIPAFARVLSGAVFVDAGNAFGDVRSIGDAFDGSLVGVGAELRLTAVLGWASSFQGRAGYAVGLTEGGYGPTELDTLYFQVGGSF